MSTPRLPVATPEAPLAQHVAQAALAALQSKRLDEGDAMVRFLRALPSVGGEMDRLEAARLVEQHLAAGLGVCEAFRLAGLHVGRDARTIRRWVVGS
ncbi:MAG: hypothetical protein QM765_20980 [Myxococcales bacterium]